jgi:prophage maintenance system killer protein
LTEHLTIGHIIGVHAEVMGRMGRWPTSLQNERGLAAVLARVRNAEERERADLIRQAAVLAIGLAQERPFEDNHVATAVAALVGFLGINRAKIVQGSVLDLARVLRVLSGEHDTETATSLFEARLRPLVLFG